METHLTVESGPEAVRDDVVEWWEGLVDLLLPDARGHIAVLRAFFDESQSSAGVFCVAGYLFDSRAATAYAVEAKRIFGPFGGFHMKDLVARQGSFKGISNEEKDDLVKAAVALTNRHITAGVTVSCWAQDVENFGPGGVRGFSRAYSMCCLWAATALGRWVRNRWPGGSGGIAYVFENGARGKGDADYVLDFGRHPFMRESYQYRSHTFVCKGDAPPLWAADLLAWEWSKYISETLATGERPPRGSLRALLRNGWDSSLRQNPKYRLRHFGGERLLKYFRDVEGLALARTDEELEAVIGCKLETLGMDDEPSA